MSKFLPQRSPTFLSIALLLGGLLVRSHLATAATIPVDSALEVMIVLERKVETVSWTAVWGKGILKDAGDSSSLIEVLPEHHRCEVIYDPRAQRYCAKLEGVARWTDGEAPYNASVQGFSFDGKEYRSWERQRPGAELPTPLDDRGRGVVSVDPSSHHIREELPKAVPFMLGTAYMPPYFWDFESPPQPLSRLIQGWVKRGREVSIVEGEDGIWTIVTPIVYGSRDDFVLRLRYDPTRGGVVVGAAWSYKGKERESTRLDIDLQELSGGAWVPKKVTRVYPLDRPPQVSFVSYEDVEINPTLDEGAFRLEFPDGVEVTDYIAKKVYVVGGAVDEQSAIREFMRTHQLTGEAEHASRFSATWGVVLVGIFVLALLGGIIFRGRRVR